MQFLVENLKTEKGNQQRRPRKIVGLFCCQPLLALFIFKMTHGFRSFYFSCVQRPIIHRKPGLLSLAVALRLSGIRSSQHHGFHAVTTAPSSRLGLDFTSTKTTLFPCVLTPSKRLPGQATVGQRAIIARPWWVRVHMEVKIHLGQRGFDPKSATQ